MGLAHGPTGVDGRRGLEAACRTPGLLSLPPPPGVSRCWLLPGSLSSHCLGSGIFCRVTSEGRSE